MQQRLAHGQTISEYCNFEWTIALSEQPDTMTINVIIGKKMSGRESGPRSLCCIDCR